MIVSAVDRLDLDGLIWHDRAPPGRLGWQSSIIAHADLIERVDQAVTAIAEGDPPLRPVREPVVLRRRTDRAWIDYRDTRQTDRMRQRVHAQNEALSSIKIGGLAGLPSQIRRQFSDTVKARGRFYAEGGAWQTLPKAARLALTLDSDPVIEIDYSALHPRLAYARCGLAYPGNAYTLDPFPRDLVKVAMAILFNGSNRHSARYVLAHSAKMANWLAPDLVEMIRSDPPNDPSTDAGLWLDMIALKPDYGTLAHRQAARLIDALIEKHDPIRSLFFCDAGMALQAEDAALADAVMATLRRRGIVALPVHDSFVVRAADAAPLEAAMTEAATARGLTLPHRRAWRKK